MNVNLEDSIQKAAGLIARSRHAVVLTGAGISTPSGIPDFRSARTGLWTHTDPMKVASLTAFRYHPEQFYNWLRPLLEQIWAAKPNPAHQALAQLENQGYLKAIITQNIDGLHQRAGSHNVLEVHGSLMTFSCVSCQTTSPSENMLQDLLNKELLPRCQRCRSILKPDIILYEEMLPEDIWMESEAHARQADLFIVAGSSLEVIPAAFLPQYALDCGARLVINNFSATHLDPEAALLLPGDVAEVLPQIAALFNS